MATGSAKAVYAAIGANSVITVTKLTAFAFTGSGTMFSEGIHSLADVINQTLLALGIKKAQKAPDADHPYGYGRDAFVWSLISAVGIFFLGCGFTLYHGVHSLLHPDSVAITDIQIAVGVLIFSFVLEAWTLWVAYKAVKESADDLNMSFGQYLKEGPDPMAVAGQQPFESIHSVGRHPNGSSDSFVPVLNGAVYAVVDRISDLIEIPVLQPTLDTVWVHIEP